MMKMDWNIPQTWNSGIEDLRFLTLTANSNMAGLHIRHRGSCSRKQFISTTVSMYFIKSVVPKAMKMLRKTLLKLHYLMFNLYTVAWHCLICCHFSITSVLLQEYLFAEHGPTKTETEQSVHVVVTDSPEIERLIRTWVIVTAAVSTGGKICLQIPNSAPADLKPSLQQNCSKCHQKDCCHQSLHKIISSLWATERFCVNLPCVSNKKS